MMQTVLTPALVTTVKTLEQTAVLMGFLVVVEAAVVVVVVGGFLHNSYCAFKMVNVVLSASSLVLVQFLAVSMILANFSSATEVMLTVEFT
jgi:hypothetical protein